MALSALLVIYIDPSEPDRFVTVTYATLALYSLYSGVLYYGVSTGRTLLPSGETHWLDVCWYLVLIALSSGTNSIFFFFFAIMACSSRWRKTRPNTLYARPTRATPSARRTPSPCPTR